MTENTRRILLSCVTLTLAACVCASLVSMGAAGFLFFESSSATGFFEPSPVVVEPNPGSPLNVSVTSTPGVDSATDPLTPAPGSNIEISPEILEQMLLIEQQVIEIRQLSSNGEVNRILLTPEELKEKVENDFFGEYTPEDAVTDSKILWAFGLLEWHADLLQIYIDLYSEGILGFYDDETGEMVVVQSQDFTGAEHLTYAHEYTHALQDQNYGLHELGYNDEDCEANTERCAALQALLEGDATLSETNWFLEYANARQVREIQEAYANYNYSAFDAAPPFLQQDLIFPYSYGQSFAEYLYNQDGWASIDAAYANVPESTEQIIHPERYPEDIPILVPLPDLTQPLGDDWELLDQNVMGEWYTFLILGYGVDPAAQLPDSKAERAAEGWGGDSYAVYENTQDGGIAMVLYTVWDTSQDAQEFQDVFQEYATDRFGQPITNQSGKLAWRGSDGYTVLYFDGLDTIWIFAPNVATADTIWDEVQAP